MDKENNEAKCLSCTRCEPTQVALLECSANQNRKCGCETGTFLELSFLICVKCKKCPRGEGVESNCSGSSDTKCAPCVEVSFVFAMQFSISDCCKKCVPHHPTRSKCSVECVFPRLAPASFSTFTVILHENGNVS